MMFKVTRWLVVGFAVTVVVGSGRAQNEKAPYQGPGTRRMAERLQRLVDTCDSSINQFLSTERAKSWEAKIAAATDPKERVQFQFPYANELLNAGESAEALRVLQAFEEMLTQEGGTLDSRNRVMLTTQIALCYLRMGEQANCVSNHTSESCLFPIRGTGVYRAQSGPREAIKVLTNLLRQFPTNLKARWLLNVAYMTVGEYPEKVPAGQLIPPEVFASDYDIKRFPDVAAGVGLDVFGLAGGCVMEDFDGDGYLDLMISHWGIRDQLRLFHNNGDGTFTERTREAGLTGELGGLNMVHTDYNNDGYPDVLILRGAWMGAAGLFPNSLMRNNGDGTFEDVTEQAGILSFHPTQTAVWFDYNNDGWIDLFIGNESTANGGNHPCELYRNNRDGTFTECAAEAGVAHVAFVKGVASADFNGDGWPDLYLSCRGQSNVLFRNDGPQTPDKNPKGKWHFTDVAAAAGVTEPMTSFPTWFFDYDNDGWPDIFVSGYLLQNVGDMAADYLGLPHTSERARLYHNNHDGTFTDVTKQTKLYRLLHAMGSNFGDLDNDGWLDFYLATGDPDLATLIPNRMFRNAEGKFFQDVTTSGGFGHLQKGHAVAFGDLDNDGDQDIFTVIGGAYSGDTYRSVLFENPGHSNHWVTLKLAGVQSNRAAQGARIKVNVKTSTGERAIYKTVSSGGSFGASPLRQEIGLGQAQSIQSVEIFWPATGKTQVIKDLVMDRFYKIREGEASATPWSLHSFQLPRTGEKICAPPVLPAQTTAPTRRNTASAGSP